MSPASVHEPSIACLADPMPKQAAAFAPPVLALVVGNRRGVYSAGLASIPTTNGMDILFWGHMAVYCLPILALS